MPGRAGTLIPITDINTEGSHRDLEAFPLRGPLNSLSKKESLQQPPTKKIRLAAFGRDTSLLKLGLSPKPGSFH